MLNGIFLAALASLLAFVFFFCLPRLHRERWQFLAAVPLEESERVGDWRGLNLTFYGFISASANATALALFVILSVASGASRIGVAAVAAATFGVCLPGARIVARLVEGKRNTFTVAGASFTGLVCFPAIVWGVNGLLPGPGLSFPPLFAALTVSFALGEGLGRLACISFGCCYGRPLRSLSPMWEALLKPISPVFSGGTKKIAYESGFALEPVVPVQALTAVAHSLITLAGCWLFLCGYYAFAAAGVVAATQAWRFLSEFLRSDHRGGSRFSVYQLTSLLSIVLAAIYIATYWGEGGGAPPNASAGLAALWSPEAILLLQALWLLVFVYMGRSAVTSSSIRFSVVRENV